MTNIFMEPRFRGDDSGHDGGIRRNVDAIVKYLPAHGYEFVTLKNQADVIVYHAGNGYNYDMNKPMVAHCHGLYWQEYEWELWAHNLNRQVIETMRRADIITAPSEWVAKILQRGMWVNPVVLHHGIELDDWGPQQHQGYVLWNKSRKDAVCDPEPVGKLAALASDVSFVSTFGDSSHNVEITGVVSYEAAKELIAQAGVYLCTARETFGIGTLEAMACGVPVLGWRWGGQTEIVTHEHNGYLATPYDYTDLLKGLQFCIENRNLLSQNAQQTIADSFQWKDAIARYADVYNLAFEYLIDKTRPKISVVIPCYNLGQYLPEAVESVVNQTLQEGVEIIIVDDASTDNSLEVANHLANQYPQVRIIHNEVNRYLAGALNTGIRASTGSYVMPLDADNLLGIPDTLKLLSDTLDRRRDLDIVFGSMELIEPDGRRWVSSWPPLKFDFYQQVTRGSLCPSTSMYRRRVWERTLGYRGRYRTAEDADFWSRAVSLGFRPQKITEGVTLVYRNRPDSMSHQEPEWDRYQWYPWNKIANITPFAAVDIPTIYVPTYEPPSVTVVIPVGPEHDKYVIDAMDSVWAQTVQNIRCIVVNDTGYPFLLQLPPWVELLEDDIMDSRGPHGVAWARNKGIAASKTKWFVTLDADDYLVPTAIEALLGEYLDHSDCKECQISHIYGDWYKQSGGKEELYKLPEFNCADVVKKSPHAITALYLKSAWQAVNGFDETITAWEDWDFLIALLSKGYIGRHIPDPVFVYRMDLGSRREMHYANREEYKQEIYNKWQDLIQQGEKMACKSCGQKAGVKTQSVSANKNGVASASFSVHPTQVSKSTEFILLEFIPEGQGKRAYVGKESGQQYIFGSDSTHKVKYVRSEDVSFLLALNGIFRVIEDKVLAGAR